MDRVIYVAETCPSDEPFGLVLGELSYDQETIYYTLYAACRWVAVALWRDRSPCYPGLLPVLSDNPEEIVVRVTFRADSHGGADLLASFNPDALTEAVRDTQWHYGGELRRFVVQRPTLTPTPRSVDADLC